MFLWHTCANFKTYFMLNECSIILTIPVMVGNSRHIDSVSAAMTVSFSIMIKYNIAVY